MYTHQDYLNGISRTRLLFNTDNELYQSLGYSEGTKTLGRIGGNNHFIKQAILSALDAVYAKRISSDLDLISLLTDYISASKYVAEFRRHKYFNSNTDGFAALIEFFCLGEIDNSDKQLLADLEKMQHDYVDVSDYVLPIMLLILWDIIPSFQNKKDSGDVDDIRMDCERMFVKMDEALEHSSSLQRYAIVDRKRKELLESDVRPNRLMMIYSLSEILLVLYNNSSPGNLLEAVNDIQRAYLDINGYWEDVEAEDQKTIWHFESEDNGVYTVRQLLKDYNDRFYRKYEMTLFYDNDRILAVLVPSDGIGELVQKGCLSEGMQVGATLCTSDDNEDIRDMELSCWSENRWLNTRRMRKIRDDASWIRHFNEINSITKKSDYEVTDRAFAITADYIYFKKKDSELLYKVPRIEAFLNAGIDDMIMLESEVSTAVGCPLNLTYLEVTTEEQMKQAGVSLVRSILE